MLGNYLRIATARKDGNFHCHLSNKLQEKTEQENPTKLQNIINAYKFAKKCKIPLNLALKMIFTGALLFFGQ